MQYFLFFLKKSRVMLKHFVFKSLNICLVLFSICMFSQEENDTIISEFKSYNEQYREVVYAHLNKNIYVKGEMLGFSAYVTNKETKTPSKITKNLYCVITDSLNNVVKSKLLKVDEGFANNVFTIDSLFTSGEYTFKVYTNWMKNFNEPNAFVEVFRVIDTEKESVITSNEISNDLDAQFLPEGGHFVDGVKTNVGVILKNTKGFGVANAKGLVFGGDNRLITSFQTNKLGLSRFLLFPEINEVYTVKINYLNKEFTYKIRNIKPKGITVHVNKSRGKVVLEFITNESTLREIKGKEFKLAVHSGTNIQTTSFKFYNINETRLLEYKDLFSGINVFTLFNEDNMPILERLFFNYEGINTIETANLSYEQLQDSTKITVPLKNLVQGDSITPKISMSILPEATKSYNRHHNILSYTYLQPYVNGFIENAQYYFTNIDRKKKFELDNLLITQGWSSYNWHTIFNQKPLNTYEFEEGITIKANNNNRIDGESFMVYPSKFNIGEVIALENTKDYFIRRNIYPIGDETLNMSVIKNTGETEMASMYVQFFPSHISNLGYGFYTQLPFKESLIYTKVEGKTPFFELRNNKVEVLDEVLVEADLNKTRARKLAKNPWDRVHVFDDKMRASGMTLTNFINGYLPGIGAYEFMGDLVITLTSGHEKGSTPRIFVDDQWINIEQDNTFLIGFDMAVVDYVKVNRHGFNQGALGMVGEIRIYTSTDLIPTVNKKHIRSIKYPVTFAEDKQFYTPKYLSYKDDFFEEYGVIDWIPKGEIDNNGNINFKVYNPEKTNLRVFIEGITEDGRYIADMKSVSFNSNE